MLLAALLAATVAVAPPTDDYPKNPRIDITHYRFELGFTDADDTLRAEAVVSARFVASGDSMLRLDLVQAQRGASGARNDGAVGAERRARPRASVTTAMCCGSGLGHVATAGERVTVRIAYRGRPADALVFGPNKYGDRTIFSDNWPNRARNWLPTVDHPYDKATSEMVVTAPAHYQVVSNGILVEETDLGDGMRRTRWVQSVPIATWLYALGVAEFAVDHRAVVRRACRSRPGSTARIATPASMTLPSRPATCSSSSASHIGPYSYAKLANVVSPTRQRGHGGGHVDLLWRGVGERHPRPHLAERDHPRDRPPVVRQRGDRVATGTTSG